MSLSRRKPQKSRVKFWNSGQNLCFFLLFICFSADGTYAMKKFMIHSKEQLELVKQEIHVSSQFNHPNLLPLLDHAIISVKVIHCIRNSSKV